MSCIARGLIDSIFNVLLINQVFNSNKLNDLHCNFIFQFITLAIPNDSFNKLSLRFRRKIFSQSLVFS